MTVLHIACLPFPTYQGTQAALNSMLRASSELGRQAHLLTYARGAYELDAPYPIHRIPDFPRVRSLRSGPSLGKLALDARCIVETRRLSRRLKPEAIVAHHIEAALATIAACACPVYYVAHTSLEHELPIYFPRLPESPIATMARYFEARVCRQAAGVAAVAPSLSMLLGGRTTYLPVPWRQSIGGAPTPREARRTLGLPVEGPVCLYAGNLDRYQGWEDLIPALAALRDLHAGARLLIATESDPAPARLQATRAGLGSAVHFCRLAGEPARRLSHAAADFTWIPRRTACGLPIKMLDAFARGLPVIAMRRATAALPIDAACLCVPDHDPRALAEAADRLLADHSLVDRLRSAALAYLDQHHSAAAFDAAMERLLGGPSRASRVRDALLRSGGEAHPAR
ncbi:MAG: glycosyltransferase family 4 protein [Deltaproteobacteria bacterium]|nr:glycosyltransferase family 4 protein [Deltaproteobacteria bacterium]